MRILYVTTISLTMNSFFIPHIEMLVRERNHVDIACNYKDLALDPLYSELGCAFYQIDFSRSPTSLDNIKAYSQLKKVLENGKYDIVHCHTPIASVVARLVCMRFRKTDRLRVFYTAHGLHFYKGAPLLNWLLFYPIEKFCSSYTDKLITINREDYNLVLHRFKAKEVHLIPGVGVDLTRFENVQIDKKTKRREIGVPEDAFLLLSVGELNENKNHQIVIKALARLNNPKVHYAIAGVGEKKNDLLRLAQKQGVAGQVHLLGYRNDIPELNCSADVFCFPSIREGLPVSLIEASACGLPAIVAKNRGTCEIIAANENGFLCENDDEEQFASFIDLLVNDCLLHKRMAKNAVVSVSRYNVLSVVNAMRDIYS